SSPIRCTTGEVPPSLGGMPYDLLPSDALRLDNPTMDAIVQSKVGRLHVATPFYGTPPPFASYDAAHFDHWVTVNNAPKLLVKARDGDFAFGTSAKITRSVFTPWAAGYAVGKTMWGDVKTAAPADVVVPEYWRANKWDRPAENAYKMAFIIVSQSP